MPPPTTPFLKNSNNIAREGGGPLDDPSRFFSGYYLGRIYQIVSDQTKSVYIGSTFNTLNQRFRAHRDKYKNFKEDNKGAYRASFEILKYQDARIILLADPYVSDQETLHMIEESFRVSILYCINKTPAWSQRSRKHIPKAVSCPHCSKMVKWKHAHIRDCHPSLYKKSKPAKIDNIPT